MIENLEENTYSWETNRWKKEMQRKLPERLTLEQASKQRTEDREKEEKGGDWFESSWKQRGRIYRRWKSNFLNCGSGIKWEWITDVGRIPIVRLVLVGVGGGKRQSYRMMRCHAYEGLPVEPVTTDVTKPDAVVGLVASHWHTPRWAI